MTLSHKDKPTGEAVSLLPCPFCGTGPSDDHLADQVQAYCCGDVFSIYCEVCRVDTAEYNTREEAVTAWNTRVSTNKDETIAKASAEAIALIDELNERKHSRVFYGIDQALHSKLCTVRATLARSLTSTKKEG